MRIARIEASAVRLPRDLNRTTGMAGSPTALRAGTSQYRWSESYPCLYSTGFETALVRVILDDGSEGWGEAQAPVAPEVACTIVEHILTAALENAEFEPTRDGIERLWRLMYSAMRVRGQTGGFMLDAIAGVDLALWDVAGKLQRKPVHALIGNGSAPVTAYLSGLPGGSAAGALAYSDRGFDHLKIYLSASVDDALKTIDSLASRFSVALDALWRLEPDEAVGLARELTARHAWFLECPFYPELIEAHARLRAASRVSVALGESYRTTFELAPFFERNLLDIVQPDLGRTGITGALAIAAEARARGVTVIPHVSIAMGPQIAAAIHFAAAARCPYLEFNPAVLETANQWLETPLSMANAHWCLPEEPGLGVTLKATIR
ncbi:MAG TPA: enolase C-terminal domain-like protein [Bryobacteraceae bacterium]|nr:enolase C-terminal domain-like protein [Bryobacteraceae bacterium]